jgi:hypothetical protein
MTLDLANEILDPTHLLRHLDFAALENCHAGRVIPAVLEALETLEEDGDCFLFSDVTDNSAHGFLIN